MKAKLHADICLDEGPGGWSWEVIIGTAESESRLTDEKTYPDRLAAEAVASRWCLLLDLQSD